MAKTKKAIKRRRKKTKKSIKRKKKLKSGTTRKLSKSSKKAKSKSKKRKTNGGKMSAEMKLSSVLDTSHLKVKFPFKAKYGNYINGKFVEPKSGKYFDNTSPISNEKICAVARSNEKDVDAALDAAHAAFPSWGKTSITERSNMLLKVADAIEKNLNTLAVAECLDNGKPIRECMAADLPLVIDHWRYFAGVIRAEEGSIAEISSGEYSYHIPEPLGVVGQIIPWNFPLLMATWKLAPALAAGNCVVLKPAEQTPASIMVLMELIGDILPPGVVRRNIIQDIVRPGGIEGVFSKFLKFDVPGLHILNIRPLTQEFKMPFAPIPVPEIGVGGLYAIEKYNVWVAGICLIVVSSSVLAVGIHSKRKIRQHLIQHEPDSLL